MGGRGRAGSLRGVSGGTEAPCKRAEPIILSLLQSDLPKPPSRSNPVSQIIPAAHNWALEGRDIRVPGRAGMSYSNLPPITRKSRSRPPRIVSKACFSARALPSSMMSGSFATPRSRRYWLSISRLKPRFRCAAGWPGVREAATKSTKQNDAHRRRLSHTAACMVVRDDETKNSCHLPSGARSRLT